MYKLLLIPHSEISEKELKEVIRIKQISWPYNYEDQIKWLRENLKDDDIHVLLSLEGDYIGYLNLIKIDLIINGDNVSSLGVGNVCTTIRGKGWGQELMMLSNNYIRKNRKTGLLFCRDRLENFYGMCKWKKIDNSKLRVGFENSRIISMYYNYHEPIHHLEFTGKIF
ncbi:MAG TPA: GNAT family N-acetyltransferase [Bacteroidales bacterium]|nr:GNAT family N-acetyltransferase [Bacteroidales bacterium]